MLLDRLGADLLFFFENLVWMAGVRHWKGLFTLAIDESERYGARKDVVFWIVNLWGLSLFSVERS